MKKEASGLEQINLALQDSNAKYQAIVKAFDGLIYVCSRDYRIEFVNERFIERTGYDPHGEFCYKAIHQRESVCPWCVNERVFAGETVRWEVQSPKDKRWYYIVNTPVKMADGRMYKQSMIVDITDRKQMEKLLKAQNDILEMVAAGRPLRETLTATAEIIAEMLAVSRCSVLLVDEPGKRLWHLFHHNLPDDYIAAIDGLAIGPSAGSCGTAVHRAETVIVEDTRTDPLWESYRHLAERYNLRACWSIPMRNSAGNVLGAFALYHHEPRRPTPEQLQMLESATHLAGIAIERNRTERMLIASEERYRSLFEQSKDAIYITSVDGRFIDVNQAGLDLFGYSRDEMLNQVNVAETYVDPSARDEFIRQISVTGSVRDFEVKLRKKDGSQMDCLLTSSIKFAKDGEVLGYQGIVRDVTEQRKAELALRQSEAQYRAIVEDQTELICRFSPQDGAITFVNDAYCRYFAVDRRDLIGRSFLPFIPEEDRERVGSHFRELSAEHPMAVHEHRVTAPDGEVRWQQWTNRLIPGEHAHLAEIQSVGRDVTERRLMQEALQKSAERIKLFAYSVSHDLKSPAVGLYGLTKLLNNQYHDLLDDRGKSYCEQILKVAEQIAVLVQKINLFVSAKEVPLEIEAVKMSEVLDVIKDEFSTQLNLRQIKWIEPAAFPEIRADRIALLRVFRNLVDNALKYGGDQLSEIRIGFEPTERWHVFSVSDNGVGLRGGESKKLFNLFERNGVGSEVEGAGLGLAIIKEIAEQHGGRVWVEPQSERGAVFYISISNSL